MRYPRSSKLIDNGLTHSTFSAEDVAKEIGMQSTLLCMYRKGKNLCTNRERLRKLSDILWIDHEELISAVCDDKREEMRRRLTGE